MLINHPRTTFGLAVISFLFPALLGFQAKANTSETGAKGAQIYCFMRKTGNEHEVSWNASYEVIKRQANSLFKTSPKHAAVMIIETVVADPNSYKDCGRYLGDLFKTTKGNSLEESSETTKVKVKEDRYSY